jgi:hypothetical protein
MEGDNKDGMPGLFKRDVAALGLASREPGSFKGTNGVAARNPGQARHTRTSTWLVSTSGSVVMSSRPAALR